MVIAKDETETIKILLANRFQEAIDEAAMRLDQIGSDDYLSAWIQSDWVEREGAAGDVAQEVVAELELEFTEEKLTALVQEMSSQS